MSLKITSNQIQIQNAQGVTKFTSDNKLVFPRTIKTGDIVVAASTVYILFDRLRANEFLHLTIKINSCTGNVGDKLIGIEIPSNGSTILDFNGRAINNNAAADIEYIGAELCGDQLVFRTLRIDYSRNIVASITSTGLTYTARIYSYL